MLHVFTTAFFLKTYGQGLQANFYSKATNMSLLNRQDESTINLKPSIPFDNWSKITQACELFWKSVLKNCPPKIPDSQSRIFFFFFNHWIVRLSLSWKWSGERKLYVYKGKYLIREHQSKILLKILKRELLENCFF